ncbi:MAG: carboxypeptidase regulatory-like domain-containing protein [Planctomycetes bacterium]|nr:carboxypeptidase regulatory-like domain-containing protein [Planctomycetota bacterium]
MRPWIHIPLLIFLLTLTLSGWVLLREVPVDRMGTAPVLAASMSSPFGPSPNGVLEGILVDKQGVPQAFADVSTLQDGRVLWTHTDGAGYFRLEGLQDGPLEVAVMALNRLPETLAVSGPRTKTQLTLQLEATPAPVLAKMQASTWRGRIRNPHAPDQLEGFEVWVNPTGPAEEVLSGVPRRALTQSDGRFEIPSLLHSQYFIQLLPPDSIGAMGPDLLVPMGATPHILDHDGTPITADLTSLGGRIGGTILTGAGAQKSPVPAAMVMITALTKGQGDGAVDKVLPAVLTDRAGRWSVGNLKPGPYRVRYRGGGQAAEATIQVEPNQSQTVVFPD